GLRSPRQWLSLPPRSGEGRRQAGRGRLLILILMTHSKIKSAPFSPFGAGALTPSMAFAFGVQIGSPADLSPAAQGKRKHGFQLLRDNCRPFPCAAEPRALGARDQVAFARDAIQASTCCSSTGNGTDPSARTV